MMINVSWSNYICSCGTLVSVVIGCSWTDLELPDRTDIDEIGIKARYRDADKDDGDQDVENDMDAEKDFDSLDPSDSGNSENGGDQREAANSISDEDEQTPDGVEQCEAAGCQGYLIGGPSADFDTIGAAVDMMSGEAITTCVAFCIAPGIYE